MHFFFVPNLSLEKRRRLKNANVLCLHAELEGETGVVIQERDLVKFFASFPGAEASVRETKYEWLWRMEMGNLGSWLDPLSLEPQEQASFSSLEIPTGTLESHLVRLCLRLRDRARKVTLSGFLGAERKARELLADEQAIRQAFLILSEAQRLLEARIAEGRVRSKEQIFLEMNAHPLVAGLALHEKLFLVHTKDLCFWNLETGKKHELGAMQAVFIRDNGLKGWAGQHSSASYCYNCSRIVIKHGTEYSHPLIHFTRLGTAHVLSEKLSSLTTNLMKEQQLETLMCCYLWLFTQVDPKDSNSTFSTMDLWPEVA